jgi:hypothetical protein
MIRLEKSEFLKRKIRKDDAADLAISNFDIVSRAITAGKADEARDFLDYARFESQANNDSFAAFAESLLTYIANHLGEEEVFKVLKPRYEARLRELLATTHSLEELLHRCIERQRGHHSVFEIREEKDRYVVTYDPCGSGGRLRRTKNVGLTQKAYPWSWGKAGVPYYCTHCCVQYEITGVEVQGYPVRITLVGDRPEDPCVHLYYKKPELIPEEYLQHLKSIGR